MKLKFLVPVMMLICLAANVEAQFNTRYNAQSLTVPNVSGDGGVSNALAIVIDARKQETTALSITTTSTNTVWRIGGSVDGSNFQTNLWIVAVAGPSTTITNLNNRGIGWLRIDSVLNTGTINATNTVSYGLKQP